MSKQTAREPLDARHKTCVVPVCLGVPVVHTPQCSIPLYEAWAFSLLLSMFCHSDKQTGLLGIIAVPKSEFLKRSTASSQSTPEAAAA